MPATDASKVLVDFGFTGLESEIYAFLLKESPATGYRIAQAIGKPAANTYKAIQTLEQKGAVLVEEGESRLCRAVPAEELLARLSRQFEARKAAAKEAFAQVGETSADDRIYQIRSREQVLHRLREMLGDAQSVALIVAEAALVEEVRDAIAAAGQREIDVAVLTTGRVGLSAAQVGATEALLAGRNTLLAVVDGREFLVAQFEDDGTRVRQAFWSRNPLLAATHHAAAAAELTLAALADRLEEGAGPKRLQKTLGGLRRR